MWERLVRFGLVGGSGVLVNLGIFRAGLEFFPHAPGLANALAVEASILSNYLLNARFTFHHPPAWISLGKYNLVSLMGALIQVGIFNGLLVLHWNRMLADLIAIPFGTLLTFGLSNSWVFRRQAEEGESGDRDPDDGSIPISERARRSRSGG